jgi:hypothetical protein
VVTGSAGDSKRAAARKVNRVFRPAALASKPFLGRLLMSKAGSKIHIVGILSLSRDFAGSSLVRNALPPLYGSRVHSGMRGSG